MPKGLVPVVISHHLGTFNPKELHGPWGRRGEFMGDMGMKLWARSASTCGYNFAATSPSPPNNSPGRSSADLCLETTPLSWSRKIKKQFISWERWSHASPGTIMHACSRSRRRSSLGSAVSLHFPSQLWYWYCKPWPLSHLHPIKHISRWCRQSPCTNCSRSQIPSMFSTAPQP